MAQLKILLIITFIPNLEMKSVLESVHVKTQWNMVVHDRASVQN